MNQYNIEKEISQALARAYTHTKNADNVLDGDLIESGVCEIIKLFFPQFLPTENWSGECKCFHTHDRHGKSFSINYSAGKCADCECLNFSHKC